LLCFCLLFLSFDFSVLPVYVTVSLSAFIFSGADRSFDSAVSFNSTALHSVALFDFLTVPFLSLGSLWSLSASFLWNCDAVGFVVEAHSAIQLSETIHHRNLNKHEKVRQYTVELHRYLNVSAPQQQQQQQQDSTKNIYYAINRMFNTTVVN